MFFVFEHRHLAAKVGAARHRCFIFVRGVAQGLGAQVTLHRLDVPVAELKARIVRRNADLPVGRFRVEPDEIDEWMTWFTPPSPEEMKSFDHAVRHTPDLA